jgi:hypothetical protein
MPRRFCQIGEPPGDREVPREARAGEDRELRAEVLLAEPVVVGVLGREQAVGQRAVREHGDGRLPAVRQHVPLDRSLEQAVNRLAGVQRAGPAPALDLLEGEVGDADVPDLPRPLGVRRAPRVSAQGTVVFG